jgi:ankyrin repeat protein
VLFNISGRITARRHESCLYIHTPVPPSFFISRACYHGLLDKGTPLRSQSYASLLCPPNTSTLLLGSAFMASLLGGSGFCEFIALCFGNRARELSRATELGGNNTFASHCYSADVGDIVTALENGKNPNGTLQSPSPVAVATEANRIDVLRELLKHKGDPNCICSNGTPAITFAVRAGFFSIAERLLEKGADVNGRHPYSPDLNGGRRLTKGDDYPNSAILAACLNERATPRFLRALIDAGGDVNMVEHRCSALAIAGRFTRFPDMLLVLLQAGADADLVIGEHTALQVCHNHVNAIYLLAFQETRATLADSPAFRGAACALFSKDVRLAASQIDPLLAASLLCHMDRMLHLVEQACPTLKQLEFYAMAATTNFTIVANQETLGRVSEYTYNNVLDELMSVKRRIDAKQPAV